MDSYHLELAEFRTSLVKQITHFIEKQNKKTYLNTPVQGTYIIIMHLINHTKNVAAEAGRQLMY